MPTLPVELPGRPLVVVVVVVVIVINMLNMIHSFSMIKMIIVSPFLTVVSMSVMLLFQ